MAVDRYKISLLELKDCPLQIKPLSFIKLLRAWRKEHVFQHTCSECKRDIDFGSMAYAICCKRFYYDDRLASYPIESIAIPTPGYKFVLPQLETMIQHAKIDSNQEFLVVPDPVYWQVPTTITYERTMKFVSGIPLTKRTKTIQPPSKASHFYKQIQEAPLNYGSLDSRSGGKNSMIRQISFGKRCKLSMRGMIVPDTSLRPNEISIPDFIVEKFHLRGKWVLLNRMPSLQPENFVALQVPVQSAPWPYDCFGIPLEILEAINGDFDGDEANIYLVPSLLAQAECATLMNPEFEMGSFGMGMKLNPSQDMLVAFYLFYEEIDFLPYKTRNLKETLRVILTLFGSQAAFNAIHQMRIFYLKKFQNDYCFALTLEEMVTLTQKLKNNEDLTINPGPLVIQILSGAKGSFELLNQLCLELGTQGGFHIKNSYWTGLTCKEGVSHARESSMAMTLMGNVWQPGYGYMKLTYNTNGLVVNYRGQVVDGVRRVFLQSALDAYHYTDAMPLEVFSYLVQEVLVRKNFNLCKVNW